MNTKKKWSYATATVTGEIERGIAMTRIRGIVTPATSRMMLEDQADWLTETGVHAHVVCNESAAMAIDVAAMLANVVGVCSRKRAMSMPTAIVVHHDQLDLFGQYDRLTGQRGICRASFLEPPDAWRWALRIAPVFGEAVRSERTRESDLAGRRTAAVVQLSTYRAAHCGSGSPGSSHLRPAA